MSGRQYPKVDREAAFGRAMVSEARPKLSRRESRRPKAAGIASRDDAKFPLWLRRMRLVKAEMKSARFPRTAQEGFLQCIELAAKARRLLWESIRADHPGAGDEEIEKERRLLLARFSAAQARWIAKWKKERDRYFRR